MKMGTIGAEVHGGGAMLIHEVGHILGQGHIFVGVRPHNQHGSSLVPAAAMPQCPSHSIPQIVLLFGLWEIYALIRHLLR